MKKKFGIPARKIAKSRSVRKRFADYQLAVLESTQFPHVSTSRSDRTSRVRHKHFKRMQTARRFSLMMRFAVKNENRSMAYHTSSEQIVSPSKQKITDGVCHSISNFVQGELSPDGSSILTPTRKRLMTKESQVTFGTPRGTVKTFEVHVCDKEDRAATTIKIPERFRDLSPEVRTSTYTITRNDLQESANKLRRRVTRKSAGQRARDLGFDDPGFNAGGRSSFEYAHDRAHSFGGSDDEDNLMIVTAACNTEMMLAELFVRRLLNTPGTESVKVTNRKEYIPGTRIVQAMNYKIEWGSGYFYEHKLLGLRTEKPIFEASYFSNIPYYIFLQQQKKHSEAQQKNDSLPFPPSAKKRLFDPVSKMADENQNPHIAPVQPSEIQPNAADLQKIGFFKEPKSKVKYLDEEQKTKPVMSIGSLLR